jgi:hypothetical protein
MIPTLEELMPPPPSSTDQIVNNLSTDSDNNMEEASNAESNEHTLVPSNEDQSTVMKEGTK